MYFCFVFHARRIAFKDYEGRRDAAKKITEESKKIEKLFKKLAKPSLEPETQCSVLPTLAEVIKLRDTSMMALEISVSNDTCHRLASYGHVTQSSSPMNVVVVHAKEDCMTSSWKKMRIKKWTKDNHKKYSIFFRLLFSMWSALTCCACVCFCLLFRVSLFRRRHSSF